MRFSKNQRDHRLEAYFATLRPLSLREALKRSAANWQIYATATASAMAMITSASASNIHSGADDVIADPVASAMPGNPSPASARVQVIRAAKMAFAVQDFQARLFAGAKTAGANTETTQSAQSQPPSIAPGGIVPLYSRVSAIQPGEWVSVYGSNLASETIVWNNDFPTSLGNTSVEINGKPAYLLFVSPGQINLQAPDDTATGTVSVVVTTAAGSAMSTVTLSQYAPSFSLLDTKHVAGIILRHDGSGAYGGGAYDILGPTGKSLGYPTVAAKAGENIVIFGFGFGPTTPAVPAGQNFSGQAPVNGPLDLYIDSAHVNQNFAGISSAGLYQINLRIPYGLGSGDVPVRAMVGGLQTQPGAMIPLEDPPTSGVTRSSTVVSPVTSAPFVSSFPVGTSGGGTGGGGGSSDVRKRHYEPRKLKFPPA